MFHVEHPFLHLPQTCHFDRPTGAEKPAFFPDRRYGYKTTTEPGAPSSARSLRLRWASGRARPLPPIFAWPITFVPSPQTNWHLMPTKKKDRQERFTSRTPECSTWNIPTLGGSTKIPPTPKTQHSAEFFNTPQPPTNVPRGTSPSTSARLNLATSCPP